ncbi:hypothetical protein AVEN_64605-1 [Araneus ventricosus]|uniref:Uncharacterized protein n=1 Tax=Araneus ventricosus TaxID=182803 RepID=A0A4Y2KID3_ARAVE|nr:hypothetical protein AVEN_64605-1 [Araneus ventricosus]
MQRYCLLLTLPSTEKNYDYEIELGIGCVADCCWHGDTPWGSMARGGYQFRILQDLPSCLWQPGHFLISNLPVLVLNNARLDASSMAVGDGTPGATTNSSGPAGIFRIMGGSKDNTRGSSSIGTSSISIIRQESP